MTYVITQACCSDAACVPVCPVNCIHPTPDEPEYATSEMLYIDPDVCIECGVCMDVCPVKAIAPDYDLEAKHQPFIDINALWYRDANHQGYSQQPASRATPAAIVGHEGPVRIAVVGSGPAACYAIEELTNQRGLQLKINVFERLPVPGGLVRHGVAPDHQATKGVADGFAAILRRPGVAVHLDVEVGTDISHDELLAHHHAVIYAVGAPDHKRMGIPGEDLPGSHAAAEFVAWYNGHPDFADREFDFSGERAVVVGNGNVALDVARILASDVRRIERTDIAGHALEQLAESRIREVVVIGRRGPAQASFTAGELIGLSTTPELEVIADQDELEIDPLTAAFYRDRDHDLGLYKVGLLRQLRATDPALRRIALRFLLSPTEILGVERVTGIRLARNEMVDRGGALTARATDVISDIDCGLVFRSVGYRGRPMDGLPFDDARGTMFNQLGRVVELDPDGATPQTGVYTVGWAKRGPSGVIGTNKNCSKETVAALLDDLAGGLLAEPTANEQSLEQLLSTAGAIDLKGWLAIDALERGRGRELSRPRVKLVDRADMREAARGV